MREPQNATHALQEVLNDIRVAYNRAWEQENNELIDVLFDDMTALERSMRLLSEHAPKSELNKE